MSINANTLLNFFKQIVCNLENNKISEQDYSKLTDLYTSYFLSYPNSEDEIDEQQMIKFMIMGWNVYKNIATSTLDQVKESE